jgi:hypothetical protein
LQKPSAGAGVHTARGAKRESPTKDAVCETPGVRPRDTYGLSPKTLRCVRIAHFGGYRVQTDGRLQRPRLIRHLGVCLQVGWKIANIQPVREPSKEIPAYWRSGPMSKVKITID